MILLFQKRREKRRNGRIRNSGTECSVSSSPTKGSTLTTILVLLSLLAFSQAVSHHDTLDKGDEAVLSTNSKVRSSSSPLVVLSSPTINRSHWEVKKNNAINLTPLPFTFQSMNSWIHCCDLANFLIHLTLLYPIYIYNTIYSAIPHIFIFSFTQDLDTATAIGKNAGHQKKKDKILFSFDTIERTKLAALATNSIHGTVGKLAGNDAGFEGNKIIDEFGEMVS